MLTALVAGAALAVTVSAYAASSPTTTATTPTTTKATTTATRTVTQPTQTVTQTQTQTVTPPTKTVTQPTQTATTTTSQTPNGAAVAAGAAGAKVSGNNQSEESEVPTWAWVLIGLGVICAAVVAFLAGRHRGQKPGEPPTEPRPPAASTEVLPEAPPNP